MTAPQKIPSSGNPAVIDIGFDRFWDRRTSINQSIAGLGFSQRLTLHEIVMLRPHLRARMLRELYPADVAGTNFNYRLDAAERHLRDASLFLFDAAFISCQPAYEEYLAEVVTLVAQHGDEPQPTRGDGASLSIPAQHRWLAERSIDVSGAQLELFDVLREARNAYVHAGGVVGQRLEAARVALSSEAEATWLAIVGSPLPPMAEGNVLSTGGLSPVGAIAAVGNLGIELNRRVVRSGIFDLARWCDVVVRDHRRRRPDLWPDMVARPRNVTRLARWKFAAAIPDLLDAEAELTEAIRRAPQTPTLP